MKTSVALLALLALLLATGAEASSRHLMGPKASKSPPAPRMYLGMTWLLLLLLLQDCEHMTDWNLTTHTSPSIPCCAHNVHLSSGCPAITTEQTLALHVRSWDDCETPKSSKTSEPCKGSCESNYSGQVMAHCDKSGDGLSASWRFTGNCSLIVCSGPLPAVANATWASNCDINLGERWLPPSCAADALWQAGRQTLTWYPCCAAQSRFPGPWPGLTAHCCCCCCMCPPCPILPTP